jgi:biotin operon repressor
MLLKDDTIAGIREGRITLLFRRWKSPRAKAGGRSRDARGVVEVLSVRPAGRLTARDARAAGHDSLAALHRELARYDGPGELYRVAVRWGGADPRAALRARAKLAPAELEALAAKLARLDARGHDGAWTERVLRAIAAQPGVVSTALALQLGMPRAELKRRVRKLKELGLTESLEVGYRLAPRGRALLTTRARS